MVGDAGAKNEEQRDARDSSETPSPRRRRRRRARVTVRSRNLE